MQYHKTYHAECKTISCKIVPHLDASGADDNGYVSAFRGLSVQETWYRRLGAGAWVQEVYLARQTPVSPRHPRAAAACCTGPACLPRARPRPLAADRPDFGKIFETRPCLDQLLSIKGVNFTVGFIIFGEAT